MLSYRRALVIAVAIVSLFVLLRNVKTPSSSSPSTSSASIPQRALNTPPRDSSVKTPKAKAAGAAASSAILPKILTNKLTTQRPLNELSGKSLSSQLEYSFPYDQTSKFPGYIWQTWRVNPSSGNFPESWRGFESSWTTQHPGFIHEVITDDGAIHVLRHLYSAIPDVIEAYESLPQPVLRADFFRYLILLARGGIYSDMDTVALKSAIEWVPESVPRDQYGLVVGIEADADREDWQKWYSRRVQFCQWTIQAKPGHPVLRSIVARITDETLRRKRSGQLSPYNYKDVMELTGPAVWTDAVFDYFNDPAHFDLSTGIGLAAGNVTWRQFTGISSQKKLGDVVVLPITSFSPGVGQMGAGDDHDPMAFVKHYFEGESRPFPPFGPY